MDSWIIVWRSYSITDNSLMEVQVLILPGIICHIFRYDVHEREVGEIALEMGFDQVSLSSIIMPMVRIVPRGYTG